MGSIAFFCNSCGNKLKAPEEAIGKRLKCPSCSNVIVVPEIQAVTEEPTQKDKIQPQQSSPEAEPSDKPHKNKQFFFSKFIQNMPFIIYSLAAHMLVLSGMALLLFDTRFSGTPPNIIISSTDSFGEESEQMESTPPGADTDDQAPASENTMVDMSMQVEDSEMVNTPGASGQDTEVDVDIIGVGGLSSGGGGSIGSMAGFEGLASAGGSGGATFHGISVRGSSFVYIVDRSGSMGGSPIALAKKELIRSIEELRRGCKFYVIFFSSGAYLEWPRDKLVKASKKNKEAAYAWINSVRTGGGTNPESALMRALTLKPAVIFFLSDGGFDRGICDRIRIANKKPISINTVGFLNRSGEPVLTKLAEDNKGKYRFVPK